MSFPAVRPLRAALLLAAAACSSGAQGHGAHDHAHATVAPNATALAQLDSARRAVASLSTPEAARAAGYRPVFGQVPLQGEHWVRGDLVLGGAADLARPPVLMFAPVAGKPVLVGAAYAYIRPVGSAPPALFDADPAIWHEHRRLAGRRDRTLQMMHAWFVDAPDGAFARYNPWLPFLAADVAPPTRASLADSVSGARERRLGLALAATVTPPLVFELLERQAAPALRDSIRAHRAAVTALLPTLSAARRAGDAATATRLAETVMAHGDAIVAAVRRAAPQRPMAARLVDRTVDEFLGRGHGIEEELEALIGGP
jgi:hypothetical protein